MAALKQSLAVNQKQLMKYQWIETTAVSLKGEQKSQIQKSCHYGPDGKVQKQEIIAPAQKSAPGGLRGRIIAKKTAEAKDYVQDAVSLVKEYVPPDSQRIDAAKNAGNIILKPVSSGVQLGIANYMKPGDMLVIDLQGTNVQRIHVDTYLDSQKEKVILDANFATLNDGTSYPAQIVLVASAKSIQIVVQNSNYQKSAAMSGSPAQSAPLSQSSYSGSDAISIGVCPGVLEKNAGFQQVNVQDKTLEFRDSGSNNVWVPVSELEPSDEVPQRPGATRRNLETGRSLCTESLTS